MVGSRATRSEAAREAVAATQVVVNQSPWPPQQNAVNLWEKIPLHLYLIQIPQTIGL